MKVTDAPRADGPGWTFRHPPRGTCHEGCARFGSCHCGCGRATKLAIHSDEAQDRVRSKPYVFSPGHHLRVAHPRVGAFTRAGVEVERVRPLIYWLRGRYGTMRAVADRIGVPESTLRGYAYKQELKRVPPDVARRIGRAVLASKRQLTWNVWE